MPFIQFTGEIAMRGGAPKPTAVISSKDEIRFNKCAAEELELKGISHALIFWDADEEIIALQPCAENAKHALPLREVAKDGAVRLPTKSFFRFFKIEGAFSGVKCTPAWDKKKEMLLLPLGK